MRSRKCIWHISVKISNIWKTYCTHCVNSGTVSKTTCSLHNWLRRTTIIHSQHSLEREGWGSGCIIPGEWPQVPSEAIVDIPRTRLGNHTENDRRVRNMFAEKFVATDIVPWQWQMIRRVN